MCFIMCFFFIRSLFHGGNDKMTVGRDWSEFCKEIRMRNDND